MKTPSTGLEKVCHFVGARFVCFHGVTGEIALHSVSLCWLFVSSAVTSNPMAEAMVTGRCFVGLKARAFTGTHREIHRLVATATRSLPASGQSGLRSSSQARLTVDTGSPGPRIPRCQRAFRVLARRAARLRPKGRRRGKPHRIVRMRGRILPRLTLIHFSISVYCGNYGREKLRTKISS
jgi:hypothetical protein